MLLIVLLLIALVCGLFAGWFDRKLTARLQWRQGPPLLQPIADILKLMGKETILPEGANLWAFIGAPIFGFSGAVLACLILFMANLYPQTGFVGDLIVLMYLLTLPSLGLIIGASASGNPLSALGASREMKLILAYELPFIVAIFSVVLKSNSIMLGNIAGQVPVINISYVLGFIVCLLVVQAKLGFVPFDMAEADQEIMSGAMLEYSGPLLAIFKLTKALLLFTLPLLLITLFMGGANFFSAIGIFWFILKYLFVLFLIILIKNTNPRIRIDQAVRFFWGPVFCGAIIAMVLSLFNL